MSKPFVVGLTGGIGSGKSAVSDLFAQQGIDIVDARLLNRERLRFRQSLTTSARLLLPTMVP